MTSPPELSLTAIEHNTVAPQSPGDAGVARQNVTFGNKHPEILRGRSSKSLCLVKVDRLDFGKTVKERMSRNFQRTKSRTISPRGPK